MSTYRYIWKDPNLARIQRQLRPAIAPSAVLSGPAPAPIVDISLTGETAEDKLDLDTVMAVSGWEYQSTNPPDQPKGLILRQEIGLRLLVDESTTSNVFVNLLSVPITVERGVLTIVGQGTFTTEIEQANVRVTVDGIPVVSTAHAVGISNLMMAARVPVPAGLRTVSLQWRAGALGTIRARPGTRPDDEFAALLVREMSA